MKYIRDCPLNCDFNYFGKTKALEYKVGPYGLLFSWYTLSIKGNCDNKPTDIFAWLRRRETSGVDWCIKLRMENDLGSDKIWTPEITW